MICMENRNGFEMLATAIIGQAAKDYRSAAKALIRTSKNQAAKRQIREIEDFLQSGWYQALTTLDGEYLLRRLREEARGYGSKLAAQNGGKVKKSA